MDMSFVKQLAFSTVRIDVEYNDGSRGSGTGFFFRLKEKDGQYMPIIVTNKHVITNSKIGGFRITLRDDSGQPVVGKTKIIKIDNFEKNWMVHPDPSVDLAIMPVAPLVLGANNHGVNFFYVSFGKNNLPSSDDYFNHVEDVLMIGYPIGLQDSVNAMPVFRKGITATNVSNDYEGKKEFLIDAACFPGSSGSPVMLWNVPYFIDKQGTLNLVYRVKLLGVLYAGPQYTAEGEIVVKNVPVKAVPSIATNIPTNLGCVIKAERILDFESIIELSSTGSFSKWDSFEFDLQQ